MGTNTLMPLSALGIMALLALAGSPVAAAGLQEQPTSRTNEDAVETRSVTFRVLGLMKTRSGAT